jgi:uncharacterized protein YjdB
VVSALLGACAYDPPTVPLDQAASFTISDAVHNGGTPGFYFLPPMVAAPMVTGEFDGALEPAVEVCEWNGAACGTTIATFTMSTGPGSETIRMVPEDQHYIVNWHTDQFGLNSSVIYRIRVLVGAMELGFADVDVVDSGRELRNVNTGEYIPLLNGRTLPIKFRPEQGIVASVALPPEGLLEVGEMNVLQPEVRDLHGNLLPDAPVAWTSSDPEIVSVDETGKVTGIRPGEAIITATSGGRSGGTLCIVLRPVAALRFGAPIGTLAVGASTQLTAVPFDVDDNPIARRTVIYSSSDPSVATVDAATGLVTGVGPGVATITGTSGGVSGGTLCVIFGGSSTGLTVASAGGGGSTGTLAPDATLQLVATFNVINVSTTELTAYVLWNTSDGRVATVSATGLVTAVAPGTATISGTIGELTGAFEITVQPSGPAPRIYCTRGTLPACLAVQLITEPNAAGGTDVALRIQNLQGSSDHDRTAWSSLYNIEFYDEPVRFANFGSATSLHVVNDGAVATLSSAGPGWILWQITASFDYTIISNAVGRFDVANQVIGCATPPSPYYPAPYDTRRTCPSSGLDGWVVFRFTTSRPWESGDFSMGLYVQTNEATAGYNRCHILGRRGTEIQRFMLACVEYPYEFPQP